MGVRGPQPNQGYADPVLSNLSVDYINSTYLSDKIFPQLLVSKSTGIYFEYDKSKFRVEDDLRAPGQRAQKVDYAFTEKTYGPLKEHGLEADLYDETSEEEDQPLNNVEDATTDLTQRILLRKEVDAFGILATSANHGTTTTLTGVDQWNEYATSDPIGDLKTAIDVVKKAILKPANELTIVMGYDVFRALEEHPQFIEKIKYSERGILTTDILRAVLGVKEILISEAEKNSANEGATDSMGYVCGNNCYVLYINPNVAKKSVTYGLTLRLTRGLNNKSLKQTEGGMARLTFTQRDELRHMTTVQVLDKYQHKVIATAAGYAIYDCI